MAIKKKEKNDKINEIRKRKLPIIKFEKGEVSWRLARVPHRDRVCVCVCNTRTLHFESEEKKKSFNTLSVHKFQA